MRPDGALAVASPSHIKFVNRDAFIYVRDFDVQGQSLEARSAIDHNR